MMLDVEIGIVRDFFAHPVVAGVDLTGPVKVGDKLRINGHTTHLILTVDSMQVDNQPIINAKAGDSVGIKVPDRVRPGDTVYLIQED
jgi:translation initiation factor IF-2|tara:strand:- start:184 stop:444 length:261 start_codon:yes stop_codon:yes gene_type:complete